MRTIFKTYTTANLHKKKQLVKLFTYGVIVIDQRVRGDSMIDVEIEKDDIVIVHRQKAVHNGDIVVTLIGEEAILKKFMSMGTLFY